MGRLSGLYKVTESGSGKLEARKPSAPAHSMYSTLGSRTPYCAHLRDDLSQPLPLRTDAQGDAGACGQ